MTYQDEFARRLGNARAAATGEDTAESRHPELVSGPRTAEPADRGKTDEILKQVQDDELTPPSRLREGGGGGGGPRVKLRMLFRIQ